MQFSNDEMCYNFCRAPFKFVEGELVCLDCGECVRGSQQLVVDYGYINSSDVMGGSRRDDYNAGFNHFNSSNWNLYITSSSRQLPRAASAPVPVSSPERIQRSAISSSGTNTFVNVPSDVIDTIMSNSHRSSSNTVVGNGSSRLNTLNVMSWKSSNRNVLESYRADLDWLTSTFQPTENAFELSKQILETYLLRTKTIFKGDNKKAILAACMFFAMKGVAGGGMTKDAIVAKASLKGNITKMCNMLENELQRVNGPFSDCFQRDLTFEDICPKIIQNLSNTLLRTDRQKLRRVMNKVHGVLCADADFGVMSLTKALAGVMFVACDQLYKMKAIAFKVSDDVLAMANNMCVSTLNDSKTVICSLWLKKNANKTEM
jgi:transcription initiation factor TFIIIB Brf1 subunit/transcription initiation factor TFIIB